MSKTFTINRGLRRLLIIMTALSVFLVIVSILTRQWLTQQGITFKSLTFNVRGSATITGLSIHHAGLDLTAAKLHARWSWQKLLHGDIHLIDASLTDAEILIQSIARADTIASEVPVIDIRKAKLSNARLTYVNQRDSSLLILRDVRLAGLRYDGTLRLDSLISKQSLFTGSYAKRDDVATIGSTTTDTGGESLVSVLPEFHIGLINVVDGEIAVHYAEKEYQISQFNLLFSGLNNRDVMEMTLHRLAFRYQDSLDVSIASDDVSLSSNRDAIIRNVSIELPGLLLSAPEIRLAKNETRTFTAKIDPSYIDTDLIHFFIPSLRSRIPRHSRIVVDGEISYGQQRLTINSASLRFGLGLMSLKGFVGFGLRDSIDIDIQHLKTSLYELSHWSGLTLPSDQKDIPLEWRGTVHGTLAHMHSKGMIMSGQTWLRYQTSLTQRQEDLAIELTLKSARLEPAKFIPSFKKDICLAISFVGHAVLRGGDLESFHFFMDGDSLFTGEQWIELPVLYGNYSSLYSDVHLHSKEDYNARINIRGDILSGETITLDGSISGRLPGIRHANDMTGDVFISFRGTAEPQIPSTDLTFDTLKFASIKGNTYTGKGHLYAKQLADEALELSVSVYRHLDLRARLGSDFITWFDSPGKMKYFPSSDVSLSLDADTSFMKDVVGMPLAISVKDIRMMSSPESVDLHVNADTVWWTNFRTRALNADIHYRPGEIRGTIETPDLLTPLALFKDVKFEVATQSDSVFTVHLSTLLPEIQRPIRLSYEIASLKNGYRVSFPDSTLLLGLNRWTTHRQEALTLSRGFDFFDGKLRITHGVQSALLEGKGKELQWKIENLDLFPIANALSPTPAVHGLISTAVTANFTDRKFDWMGKIGNVSVDTVRFGDFTWNGHATPDSLQSTLRLHHNAYDLVAHAIKPTTKPLTFDMKLAHVDLRKFSSLIPLAPSTLAVSGILNAELHGSYDEALSMRGYVVLPNTEVISSEYDVYLKADNDSLILNGTSAIIDNFIWRDRKGNPITVHGWMQLAESSIDLSIRSDKLRLLDRTQPKATLSGAMDVACDVRVKGKSGRYKVSGKMATLSGGSITYLYKSTVTLDDRQREMEFVNFNQTSTPLAPPSRKRRTRNPLEWDVVADIGSIDITVLFSQVNQDHIKTVAGGRVTFKTGNSAEPSAFGLIESNSGTIAYHVPMISDLRMVISKAGIRWVGDVAKPLLSFHGSQVFRISPNEISSLWSNKSDRWPIAVIAKINDRPMNDLVLNFDLSSTNNQVSDWISGLPEDTREAYAVSLLLRGRINTGGTANVNLVTEAMVSKMNELSSRNIKSADVSFYDDSRGPNSTEGSNNKIGYSISKGLANKKMRIVLGGSVDLTGQADPSMPDVKVEYVLREDPTITLRAGKANVYTGVIDGNVDESSFGLTYIKRFRNLFKQHHNRSEQ